MRRIINIITSIAFLFKSSLLHFNVLTLISKQLLIDIFLFIFASSIPLVLYSLCFLLSIIAESFLFLSKFLEIFSVFYFYLIFFFYILQILKSLFYVADILTSVWIDILIAIKTLINNHFILLKLFNDIIQYGQIRDFIFSFPL